MPFVEYDDNRAEIERSANQDVIDIEAETGESEQEEQKVAEPEKEKQPEKKEQKQEPKEKAASKEEAQENGNGNHDWFRCPKKHKKVTIGICENNCPEFQKCEIAQNKIAELMAEDAEEEETEQQAAAAGPDF